MLDANLSKHPIDQLIRDVVRTRRAPKPADITSILGRIATAAFSTKLVQVDSYERGIAYGDRRLVSLDDSLFVHLVRRVVVDQQWIMGTTGEQYVDDLRGAARAEGVALAIYPRRGGSIAAVLAQTHLVVPEERRGPRSLPTLIVVYSADRGIIVTGYQVERRESISIAEDALWLP